MNRIGVDIIVAPLRDDQHTEYPDHHYLAVSADGYSWGAYPDLDSMRERAIMAVIETFDRLKCPSEGALA